MALPAVLEAHLSSGAPSRLAHGSPDQAEGAAVACRGISWFSDLRAQLGHKTAWEEGIKQLGKRAVSFRLPFVGMQIQL